MKEGAPKAIRFRFLSDSPQNSGSNKKKIQRKWLTVALEQVKTKFGIQIRFLILLVLFVLLCR